MTKHWTQNSIEDFLSRISFDFIAQLERRLDELPMSQAELADRLKQSESQVSQMFNNIRNPTLKSIVRYASGVGMKVAVVAYDDSDPDNTRGPVNSDIFTRCWERQGKPADFFALNETISETPPSDYFQQDATENVVYMDFMGTLPRVAKPKRNAA